MKGGAEIYSGREGGMIFLLKKLSLFFPETFSHTRDNKNKAGYRRQECDTVYNRHRYS